MYRPITLPLSRDPHMFVRTLLISLLIALSVAAASTPVVAQQRYPGGIFTLYYLDVVPAEFVAAALAPPYGRLLVSEFAAILDESADAACLQSKGIAKTQLPERAGVILQQRGTHLLATYIATIDRAAYERYLPARIGRDGVVEFARLKNDPKVQAYVAAEAPARYANVLNVIAENLARFVLIMRIKLVRSISPYDNNALDQADPTDATQAELEALVANDKTDVLERYLGMSRAAQVPFDDAVDSDKLKSYSPGSLLDGIEGDLAELCIPGADPHRPRP
jgi:hypothetical protein